MSTRLHPGAVPGGRSAAVVAAVAAGAAAGAAVVGPIDPKLAAVAVIAAAGAFAVIVEADWALVTIAAFAVLRLAEVATEFHGAPSLFQPVIAAIVVGIALRWVVSGERPQGGGRALLVVGAYFLTAAASLLVAGDMDAGLRELESLAKDGAVAVLIGLLLHRGAALRRMIGVLIGGGALLGTLSMIQVVTGDYGSSFLGFAQSSVENIVGATDDIRISGPIGDANFYAQVLVMILPLALDRMWRARSRSGRLGAGYAAAVTTAAIVMTYSRGGALALAVVAAFMLATHPPKLRSVVGLALAAVLAIPLIPDAYIARLGTLTQIGTVDASTDISIRYRTAEVGAAVGMVQDHPLTGVGYGNYAANYQDYSRGLGIDLATTAREPHNLFLEVAAETGIPGVAAFGLLLGVTAAAVVGSRRRLRAAGRHDEAAMAYALGVALIGHLVTSVFLHLDFARFFWTYVGIALALPNVAARESADILEPA